MLMNVTDISVPIFCISVLSHLSSFTIFVIFLKLHSFCLLHTNDSPILCSSCQLHGPTSHIHITLLSFTELLYCIFYILLQSDTTTSLTHLFLPVPSSMSANTFTAQLSMPTTVHVFQCLIKHPNLYSTHDLRITFHFIYIL